jgi:O-antigen ligase
MTALPATAILAVFDRYELRNLALTTIVILMLGGVFPSLVASGGPALDTLFWVVLLGLVASFWLELPMPRLLRPVLPFSAWLLFYLAWGTLAAPYPILDEAVRMGIKFFTLIMAMAVVTSTPHRLRVFANGAQLLLLVNLAVTVLLITRPEYQQHPFFAKMGVEAADRFAGLWGNANAAGLTTLVVLTITRWASPRMALVGRLCGPLIIYLTESRTATWLLVAMVVFYLAFLARARVRLRALVLLLALAAGALYTLNSTGSSLAALAESNPGLARILDVTESRTTEAGGQSRLEVLKDWLGKVPGEPWYGYGLYTFFGGESDKAVPRPGFPTVGPHNQYLAIFLDIGGLGLVSYLAILALQLAAIRRARLVPGAGHMLYALFFTLLCISNFSHNMLTDYTGWEALPLLFLLPASPALAADRLEDDGSEPLEGS